jgi:magnesium transporter
VVDPNSDEIESLAAHGIPQDFLTYPLDVDERPRVEKEDDGTLLILIRVPYFQGRKEDIPFYTIPLGIIITSNLVLTVCRRQNDIIQEITGKKYKTLSTAKRNRFLLLLLLNTAAKFLSYLRDINKSTEALEDKLQQSIRNNEVYELLKYQKSLVYFKTALKSNELVLERLDRMKLFHQYPDDEDLLEDVITENQQAIETTNISSDILSSMMDAFASIISNNLNDVMKFLTSITIVISLPTMITSFFGQNIPGFWTTFTPAPLIILTVCVLICILVIYIFRRRDWL